MSALVRCDCAAGRLKHPSSPACRGCGCRRSGCLERAVRRHLCAEHYARSAKREAFRGSFELMRSICDLRREILKLAAVDALPYARALRAVDDALAVFDLVQGATGGEVRARGRGPWGSALYLLSDGRVSCSAHADDDGRVVGDGPFDDRKLARHALARIVDDIRGRLADEVAERIDWWVVDGAEQMVQAGLLDKVQAALVYAGASR